MLSLALVCMLAPAARTQSSAWSDLQVPQGVVSNAVQGQGKLVSYRDGNTLHMFSAVTRIWHEVTTQASSSVRLFNDCAVIVEPNLLIAFSSHTGQFQELITSAPASVLNPVAQKNDSLILVHSGTEIHAFSAFTGQWTSLPVVASFGAEVQRHVAVVQNGSTIAGISAFDGVWHPHTFPSTPTSISADGTAGFIGDGNTTCAFSAHTRLWLTEPLPTNATFLRGDDWGIWLGTGEVLAYSSLRGEFLREAVTTNGVAGSTDLYALMSTPTGLCAYSAVTGDLLAIPHAPNSIEFGGATALLQDNKSVRGYSALRQQVATLLSKTASSDAGNVVALVTSPSGQCYAWSSYTASWHAAPAATNGGIATMTETTIGLLSPTDCYAFAARSAQFVALGNQAVALSGNPSSAPLLGYTTNDLIAFDTDGERWLSTPRNSTSNPNMAIWRTSAIALDGTVAQGFGAQAGTWQAHQLMPGPASLQANSEVAYVIQPQQIAACSMLGEIISYQQFPHFRRVQPRTSAVTFAAAPQAYAVAIAAFAPPMVPVVVPGLGTLLLDTNFAMFAPIMPTQSQPVCTVSLQLPGDGIFAGTTLASQLLVLPTAAPAYISDRATVQLW